MPSRTHSKVPFHPIYFFLITIVLVFSGWYGVIFMWDVPPQFLPPPHAAFQRLYDLGQTADFWKDVGASWVRILFGFLTSIAVAYPLVVLSLRSNSTKVIVFNIVEFFRYLPIPVFIPLTVLWFGVNDAGKIVIVFLGTFAQMIPMYYDSATRLESEYKAFSHALKWSRWQHIRKVLLPGALPGMIDDSRLCFGWAWTYLIIAELLGAEHGIGYAIVRAQRFLKADQIFAYIIVIGVIGLLVDRLFVATNKRMFPWAL